jgi:hypothetical protein
MTDVTISVPDELAAQLHPFEKQLPEALALGVRQLQARQQGTYESLADVTEKLAQLPEPQEVLAIRPSEKLQTRLREMLQKNRHGELSPTEEQEWRQFEYVEHLVRIAKARAAAKLKNAGSLDHE